MIVIFLICFMGMFCNLIFEGVCLVMGLFKGILFIKINIC